MSATGYYRFDLDKTYLATPLEHKLQLVKVPFQAPESKRTLPGMNTLVRSVREQPAHLVDRVHVSILSASPQFMSSKLQAKMELDNVKIDRFIFKNQWSSIKRGRLKEISNPLAYKLHALCDLGLAVGSGDFEVLVGDDYNMDPEIYTLYANLRAQQVSANVLHGYFERHKVGRRVQDAIWSHFDRMSRHASVRRIFIRRVRRRGDGYFRNFGTLLKSYEDTFQLILLMFDDGCVNDTAVQQVAEALQHRRWRRTAFAFSWRSLVERHYLNRFREIRRVIEKLNLIPRRTLWERVARGAPPRPPGARPADWQAIALTDEV